ncbi:hypothetical protein ACFC5X_28425 [Streptomyces sp. NPDC055952]|uniref:hypothetical protein n=1 Tax=Streptomyces sp. NPDC055952 TaxID=3345663 RepID=UPI0035E01B08
MSASTLRRSRPAVGTPPLPPSLPRPVTAVLTTGGDDRAVLEVAVRPAAPRPEPVLLAAPLVHAATPAPHVTRTTKEVHAHVIGSRGPGSPP